MTGRLSDETLARIATARHALERTRLALSAAQRLEALALERYNAELVAAGFDPETFVLQPDGTATDGVPDR